MVDDKKKMKSVTALTKKSLILASQLAYKYKARNNNDLTLGETYDKYIEN